MSHDVKTISNFNLEQYLGIWYEIARLPMKHQPENSTDISAAYSLNENGTVRVQNRCLDGAGKLDESIGKPLLLMRNMANWKSVSCLKVCAGYLYQRGLLDSQTG